MADTLHILDLLGPSAVVFDLKATTKKAALEELVQALHKDQKITDMASVLEVLHEREKLGSTGIGQGIAIPHAKTDQAANVSAVFGLARKGIPFDSLDGEPVHLIFMLVSPTNAASDHLRALARLSRMLKDKFFRQTLREAKDAAEVLHLIREEDRF